MTNIILNVPIEIPVKTKSCTNGQITVEVNTCQLDSAINFLRNLQSCKESAKE